MRYPESKIKAALLHPDPEVRDRATLYFAKAFSRDPEIMPLVIEAIRAHGRTEAYKLIGSARSLVQTEATIAWVIDELSDESCNTYENYAFNLSMILMEADPALLQPREADILAARHFPDALRTPLGERLKMLAWDEATCWQKLQECCDAGVSDSEVPRPYDEEHVIEALARFGPTVGPVIHERLAVKVDDTSDAATKWLEPLYVRLAGRIRWEPATELIVAKLHEEYDYLNEQCVEALTRIGTPAVVEAVAAAFPTAPDHFKIYASSVLEYVRSDLAVEACLKLLGSERDEANRTQLGMALLYQFASDGIDVVRQMLVGRGLKWDTKELRNCLVETCTFTGEHFPEYDEWRAAEKAEKAEHFKRVSELENDPARLMLYALEKITGKTAAEAAKPEPKPFVLPSPLQAMPRKPEVRQAKVGRNDPCPCGSGKKFKACCLNK